MEKKTFEEFWYGTKKVEKGWNYKVIRETIRQAFPSPYRNGPDVLKENVNMALDELNQLKPEKKGWGYLGEEPTNPKGPDYGKAKLARMDQKSRDLKETVKESVNLFKGMPHWNHPLVMPNVIPPANIASVISAFMTDVFSPNIIEGEYAWNIEYSELESAAMVADLIGWDPKKAGGLFTYGGSGCYLYGMKYALTRVLGMESRNKGIRTDGKVLVSQQGHYCKMNSTDWTGLGMDNIIEIETNPHTNAMDVNHLEKVMKELHEEGIPVISVICTMGTTDAFAIDPVAEVRGLIEKYPNPAGYGKAFLYCDAVIGWSWLTFGDYDFENNPLKFSPEVLPMIRKNLFAIQDIVHADAIGCDFHKVGWSPYNCSLFIYPHEEEFKRLMIRPGSDYLQERTEYNPGLYTVEVSRSGSYSMAGWATLKFLGKEGFQTILGSILELGEYFKLLLKEEKSMLSVNDEDTGFVSLFRVYPEGVDAEMQYKLELTCPEYKKDLEKHNALQERIADKLWEWYRTKKEFDVNGQKEYTPYISYSSGFRPTEYNMDSADPYAKVYALKSFPMNLNIGPDDMKTLIRFVKEAREEILQKPKQMIQVVDMKEDLVF
jgi:glutamate/tyrosine decarboxylase-like PLP-dependent enzyme